jgi:hypothetical protein
MSEKESRGVTPQFYKTAIKNDFKSQKEGRPIFDEVEMVRVVIPGDRLTKPSFLVDNEHRQRWPEAYSAFKRGEERAATGTPVEHWPILTTGRVAELKAMNIFSVEEYAEVSDANLAGLGFNARAERDQAKAFLANAKSGAANAEMAAELSRLREMVERLQSNPASPVSVVQEPQERDISELSDADLKAYIKKQTGEGVRGNPKRETLLAKVTEIATKVAA